jgi:hypothetical protein
MNNIAHSKSVTAIEVVDIDDRKCPPESVNKVQENFVIASEAVDIDDRKRPPEIGNEVMENFVTATEAVDIDDQKRPPEIVPLLAQAKANIQEYEWNTHIIAANNKTPPSKVSHPSNVSQPIVPSLPPMMQCPSSAQVEELRGIWMCENCDYHCDATKKRCSKCRKWRMAEGIILDMKRM